MIIGQHRVLSQLEDIAFSLKIRTIRSINILLRAPPGYGKTEIAHYIAKSIDNNYSYQQVKKKTIFDNKMKIMRVHIIDEIHLDKEIENLYSLMTMDKYVFIFCTTESGSLPDAFTSRCSSFTLDDYTTDELSKIVYSYAMKLNFYINKRASDYIASISRGSPRVAKNLLDRIRITILGGKFSLDQIIEAGEYIGVHQEGFTDLDYRYLQVLTEHKTLGLNNLARILRVDTNTLTNVIEPFLLSKNLITIGSKGRKIC